MPDTYINEVIASQTVVAVITINGFQMRGRIVHCDKDYIVINCNDKNKMVYKHAISTIEPA